MKTGKDHPQLTQINTDSGLDSRVRGNDGTNQNPKGRRKPQEKRQCEPAPLPDTGGIEASPGNNARPIAERYPEIITDKEVAEILGYSRAYLSKNAQLLIDAGAKILLPPSRSANNGRPGLRRRWLRDSVLAVFRQYG